MLPKYKTKANSKQYYIFQYKNRENRNKNLKCVLL